MKLGSYDWLRYNSPGRIACGRNRDVSLHESDLSIWLGGNVDVLWSRLLERVGSCIAPSDFPSKSRSPPSSAGLETAGSEALLPLIICGAAVVGFVGTLNCLLGAAFLFKGGRSG